MKKFLFTLMIAVSFSCYSFAQDAFIGEIRIIATNFAPVGWKMCNGEILQISEHQALYSLLGTTYGGDGKTTFALPNLCGRVPVGPNPQNSNNLSERNLGQTGGTEMEYLRIEQLPPHNHNLYIADTVNKASVFSNALSEKIKTIGAEKSIAVKKISDGTIEHTGGNRPHNNMMPYLVLNYIICVNGLYPMRP